MAILGILNIRSAILNYVLLMSENRALTLDAGRADEGIFE